MGVLAASEEQNARTREISLLRIDIKKKGQNLTWRKFNIEDHIAIFDRREKYLSNS